MQLNITKHISVIGFYQDNRSNYIPISCTSPSDEYWSLYYVEGGGGGGGWRGGGGERRGPVVFIVKHYITVAR